MESDDILDGGVGKRLGSVELPRESSGPRLAIPLAVVQGATSGPTVWVNAALHGDEYLGPATVVRLLRELDPAAVRGRLILTPTLNPGGIRAMQREDPDRPADLNRIWAPDSEGTAASRLTSWAATELLGRSEYVVDLHSGGNRFSQEPFTAYPRTGQPVDDASSDLAKACGLRYIWAHQGSILEGALITAAARKGKPAVLIEMAGEGKAEPTWIDSMAAAVRGALAHVGVVAGSPRLLPSYQVFEGFTIVRNRSEGLWHREVEPAAPVRSGATLGRVTDLLGRELEAVAAPTSGVVVGICTYGFVPAQDYVAELAHGFRDEGPPA